MVELGLQTVHEKKRHSLLIVLMTMTAIKKALRSSEHAAFAFALILLMDYPLKQRT